jgi:hypothetical protein
VVQLYLRAPYVIQLLYYRILPMQWFRVCITEFYLRAPDMVKFFCITELYLTAPYVVQLLYFRILSQGPCSGPPSILRAKDPLSLR